VFSDRKLDQVDTFGELKEKILSTFQNNIEKKIRYHSKQKSVFDRLFVYNKSIPNIFSTYKYLKLKIFIFRF